MTSHGHDDPRAGTGAIGNASADTATPFMPRRADKTPVGDTDQHSKVPHNGTPEQERVTREGAKHD